MTDAASRRRARVSAARGDRPTPWTLDVLVTARAHVLAFSLPYLWLWTAGLPGIVRAALTVAHAASLLAIAAATTAGDARHGLLPRLGLLAGSRMSRPELAVASMPVLALVAVAAIAALAAAPAGTAVPASIVLLLAGGLAWARMPPTVKYLGIPEWAGPGLALAVPAATLALATEASPPWQSVVAGVACMTAIVLATHLRDRAGDLAADVPTAATRRPYETSRWTSICGATGSLAVLVGLYVPLGWAEWSGLMGAVTFAFASFTREPDVRLMTAAHGVIGLSWLWG